MTRIRRKRAGRGVIEIILALAIALSWSRAARADSIEGIGYFDRPGAVPIEPWTQVPSVSALSDVQPTDWAYEALRSLIERYGIPAGFPDGIFRGNRALTRYEFAAALAQVLREIERRIQLDQVGENQAELRLVRRLTDEFRDGLIPLGNRMAELEMRTATLEQNQFSPTAKLYGEAIFDISGQLVSDREDRAVFQSRVHFDVEASFTGSDALRTRLLVASAPPRRADGLVGLAGDIGGSAEGRLITSARGSTGDDLVLDQLAYTTALGTHAELIISAAGGQHSHYVHSTVNPVFDDRNRGFGALSTFAQASPIYRIGGGAGVGIDVTLADGRVALSAGYLAETAAEPEDGLFSQDYAALGQLTLRPSNRLELGFTYVHGYHTDDNAIFDAGIPGELIVGTFPANAAHAALHTAAVTNSYGLQASYAVSRRLTLNAFGGYTDLQLTGAGDGEIWYYGLGAGVVNLILPQSLVGILVGAEPYLNRLTADGLDIETDTSLHIEAFYRLQLSDAISLTPGLIWITAPNQDRSNEDAVIATFRTTFRF